MKTKLLIIFIFSFLMCNVVFSQWVQVWNGMGQTKTVLSLYRNSSFLFAGLYWGNGIYISTNEGLTWTVTSLSNKDVWDFTSVGSVNYACSNSGIYLSYNGTTWTSFALSNKNVYEVAINGNYMYAGTENEGVYYSSNNGVSWTQSFLNNKSVWSVAVYNNYVIAGTYSYGIYHSTDNGYVWSQSNINNITVERIKFDGNIAYAGTSNGIYKSTNFGVNWSQFALTGKNINDFQINVPYIYAGTDIYGVYILSMQGIILNQINEGFPVGNFDINSLVFTNNYFVAGSSGQSVWRRSNNEIGIQTISNNIPSEFKLLQNYPNPFNPSTQIQFDLQKSAFVKLIVYDVLGKEVAQLVNEDLRAGSYSVDWNAGKYPSGVYFYKILSGDYSATKRMVLLK